MLLKRLLSIMPSQTTACRVPPAQVLKVYHERTFLLTFTGCLHCDILGLGLKSNEIICWWTRRFLRRALISLDLKSASSFLLSFLGLGFVYSNRRHFDGFCTWTFYWVFRDVKDLDACLEVKTILCLITK